MDKVHSILLCLMLITCLAISTSYTQASTQDSWETKAAMPTGRSQLGVAVVQDKIYAIGGEIKKTNLESHSNEMYDPSTNTWTTKQPMPTVRGAFGIAAYNNKIYCISGCIIGKISVEIGSWEITGVNEVYDPQTNTWSTKASMPNPRYGLNAHVINGKIYLIGGHNGTDTVNLNSVYDIATDTWSTKTPVPHAVQNYASAVVGDKIYLIGGFIAHPVTPIVSDKTQVYDPKTDTWSNESSAIPTSLRSGKAVAVQEESQNKIYVIGGSVLGTWVYTVESDSWVQASAMSTDRDYFGIGVANDALYVIGGANSLIEQYMTINESYKLDITESKPFITETIAIILGVAVASIVIAASAIIVYHYKRKSAKPT
ncbi:MAG: hypothetical protein NWF01_02235 [Candidatus Bathyarchaeota archaeon]|nr:hypothetical protein [Candidatus Bathyarchaeota archaeon]